MSCRWRTDRYEVPHGQRIDLVVQYLDGAGNPVELEGVVVSVEDATPGLAGAVVRIEDAARGLVNIIVEQDPAHPGTWLPPDDRPRWASEHRKNRLRLRLTWPQFADPGGGAPSRVTTPLWISTL